MRALLDLHQWSEEVFPLKLCGRLEPTRATGPSDLTPSATFGASNRDDDRFVKRLPALRVVIAQEDPQQYGIAEIIIDPSMRLLAGDPVAAP